ncbi:MAG: hypothetical protein ACFFB3_06955 [Candidatus Hodarchaeota archaeon]
MTKKSVGYYIETSEDNYAVIKSWSDSNNSDIISYLHYLSPGILRK